jgi:hypothetical protein
MFLVGILSWWYGNGWRQRLRIITERIARTNDYFSIGLLLSTLFAPFRQISASSVDGSVAVQLRAFADKLISRIIGLIVRTFMIVFGLVVIILQSIFGIVVLAIWAFVPLFPVIGLLMMVIGWVPTWS